MKYLFPIIFSIFILVNSCSNPCKDLQCGTHGNCTDGSCECESGWLPNGSKQCEIKDSCYQKDCSNGTCSGTSGACLCDSHFEKDNQSICTIKGNTKFIGAWRGISNFTGSYYVMTLEAFGNSASQVVVKNFAGYTCNSGQQTYSWLYVNEQKDINGKYIQLDAFPTTTTDPWEPCNNNFGDAFYVHVATANIDINAIPNKLTMYYSFTKGGISYTCTDILERQ